MAEDDDERMEKSRIKPAQVAASALAAVTAAFLGSALSLGITGTWARRSPGSRLRSAASCTCGWLRKTKEPLAHNNRQKPSQQPPGPAWPASLRPAVDPPPRLWWKNTWVLTAVSVVAFVIGMVAVTGFEALTGHALSGDSGTTAGCLFGGTRAIPPTTTQETVTVTQTPSPPSSATNPTTTQRETPTVPSPAPSSSGTRSPCAAPPRQEYRWHDYDEQRTDGEHDGRREVRPEREQQQARGEGCEHAAEDDHETGGGGRFAGRQHPARPGSSWAKRCWISASLHVSPKRSMISARRDAAGGVPCNEHISAGILDGALRQPEVRRGTGGSGRYPGRRFCGEMLVQVALGPVPGGHIGRRSRRGRTQRGQVL